MRFADDIAKLNQQSIIKGFHRVSLECKEALLSRPHFGVELYVPPHKLSWFQATFAQEAWETPESILTPGRLALYPGLAPPKQMLALDGWTGKRPELIEAIHTEGRSLELEAPKSLGGTPQEEMEVYANLNLTNSKAATAQMLALEESTARAAGLEPKERKPLRPGLQED